MPELSFAACRFHSIALQASILWLGSRLLRYLMSLGKICRCLRTDGSILKETDAHEAFFMKVKLV